MQRYAVNLYRVGEREPEGKFWVLAASVAEARAKAHKELRPVPCEHVIGIREVRA
jgi:hypothetical protein